MNWNTFETCPVCGRQHSFVWPHSDVPDNMMKLEGKCPSGGTVVLTGIRAWSDAPIAGNTVLLSEHRREDA